MHLCHHLKKDKPNPAHWSQDEAESHDEQSPVIPGTGEEVHPDQLTAEKSQTGVSRQDPWSLLADSQPFPEVGTYTLIGMCILFFVVVRTRSVLLPKATPFNALWTQISLLSQGPLSNITPHPTFCFIKIFFQIGCFSSVFESPQLCPII